MKKKYLILFICIAAITKIHAQSDSLSTQSDTLKIEQYCEVVATGKLFSNKVTIDVDFGEARKFWSDNRIKSETGKVKNFNTIIDAMNYMGAQGWTLATALLIGTGPYVYHYIFRKEVLKSEIRIL